MPTPVGHSLLGGIIYYILTFSQKKWEVNMGLWMVFLANAADLDFLPGFFLETPNRFHHGISHSFGCAIFVGLLVSATLCIRGKERFWFWGILTTLVYSSHVLLDYFSADSGEPFGVPMFWPISNDYFISPFMLFLDVRRGDSNMGFLLGLFSFHNGMAVLREMGILTIAFLGYRGFAFYINNTGKKSPKG